MARNIEIKAQIEDLETLEAKVAELSDHGPTEILQDDTFFSCINGRMKLRVFSDTEGQLIFYQRSNKAGPKESFYVISPTTTPDILMQALSLGYGQIGRVRKQRTLFLIGRTRIHLDRVEGLGHFLEIEVVLAEEELSEAGVLEAHDILGKLEISNSQLIEEAYIDLLNGQNA